jgi:hypothetical protein
MKQSKKLLIKNQILIEISKKRGVALFDISKVLNKPLELVGYLVEEIKQEGLISLIKITSRHSIDIPNDYMADITNKGIYFLKIENGYLSTIKKEKRDRIWYYTKTSAAILNAIAILAIGFLSILVIREKNILEEKNNQLNQEISKLKEILSDKDSKSELNLEIETQLTTTNN